MAVRLANLEGRASLLVGAGVVDVERGSGGRFSTDPMDAVGRWPDFVDWAAGVGEERTEGEVDEARLGPPLPRPSKIFGVGMNYRAHADEAGLEIPRTPVIFTKFPNCLTGPRGDVVLTSGYVDWEVELVVVFGRRGRRISEERALDYVAGYCVGQDISDRKAQFADRPPQFSMGKSADTFGPLGPALVSLDAFRDANDLAISCEVSGERVQDARTSDMIFSVAQLVAFLSRRCTIEPGDLVFTGTPAGVGSTRKPRRYLKPGEVIASAIEGIGTLINRCVEGEAAGAD